jgi:lysophospholipase L1-like esterase
MRREPVPPDLEIRTTARKPVERSDLGIDVAVRRDGSPRHRLVAIGDSLTHGFQSGAIYNTDLSYPALIARKLGWYSQFRRPHYPGFGGVPINIEFLIRDLESEFGDKLEGFDLPLALFRARHHLAESEHYWDKGPGSELPAAGPINHNLGIYGWDLRDALQRTADTAQEGHKVPDGHHIVPLIKNAERISAGRVLGSARKPDGTAMTPFEAAEALSREGTLEGAPDGDGIETLIVFLGANNALGTVIGLQAHWSGPGYDDLKEKGRYNVWHPDHFAAEWALVVEKVRAIRARHVIFGTVPHVTVAPIAHGVGKEKVRSHSRYFPYYTRPWIEDKDFDPADDEHLTADEARAIDSAIDAYNDIIVGSVEAARNDDHLDWRVLDVAGVLDRLAKRRYIEDPDAAPDWWTPYPLPDELAAMDPVPDTHFFSSGPKGLISGGLIALDGIHPTTIGYGILAQEFMRVMQEAGVEFIRKDGSVREGEVTFNWPALILADSLISQPPRSLGPDLNLVGWFDERIDIIKRLWTCAA